MARILVTGGTGFVGRFIVENLCDAGHEVAVFGRREPAAGFFAQPVGFIRGSLEPDAIDPTIFTGIDQIVHAAFDHQPGKYRGGEGDDSAGFVRRNRDGSMALLAAAKASGVRRAVFLSTRAIYGPKPAGTVLRENDDAIPDTLYGHVKLDVEQALLALADDTFTPVVLRVTGVYGPGATHKWVELFADYLSGRPVAPRVGTEVHGQDVASAVRIALAHPAPPPILNVSDITLDRHDLLGLVQRLTGSAYPLPQRADAAAINVMDSSRLKSLGWTPGGWPLLQKTVRALIA